MIWLAISMISTILLCLMFMTWRLNQKAVKLKSQLDMSLDVLKQQHDAEKQTLLNADLQFNQQLNDLQQQILSLDKQIQSNSNIRSNDGGYQHALKILSMGGSKEEIMESCHLSNAEAELLMNLNAYRSALAK